MLDEPTSALSPETRAEIIELLIRLSRELDIAYLFISHDLTTIERVCDRVVVMYLGQVVETGTRAEVFQAPLHPYSGVLLASHLFPDIADRRVDRPERVTLKGEIPSPVSLPEGCYLYGRCPKPGGALPRHAASARRGFGRPLGALLACSGRGASGLGSCRNSKRRGQLQ